MPQPLYQTCPKCGHRRAADDNSPRDRCPRCGLYFKKWLKSRFRHPVRTLRERRAARTATNSGTGTTPGTLHGRLRQARSMLAPLLFPVQRAPSQAALIARAALWLVLVVWGGWFILTDHRLLVGGLPPINYSIMHSIDLVFHEAGHVIFALFGNFMAVLGGSLMQLLVPVAAGLSLLLRQHDPFGASVMLWWFAQSLMDVAPYIYDARRQQMLLLGGGTGRDRPGSHDWNNLLGRTGLLEWDHGLAWLTNASAVLLMLAALAWGGLLLRAQYRARRQAQS